MKHVLLGVLLGSLLTGTVVGAGQFYDSKGNVSAPRGSVQQFDYFRQRQFFLDQGAMRRHSEEMLRQQKLNPCAK
jgi:hypothetical protein